MAKLKIVFAAASSLLRRELLVGNVLRLHIAAKTG
jgi:hypothetical protein